MEDYKFKLTKKQEKRMWIVTFVTFLISCSLFFCLNYFSTNEIVTDIILIFTLFFEIGCWYYLVKKYVIYYDEKV